MTELNLPTQTEPSRVIPTDLDAAIKEAAASPKSVTVDGQNVQARDLNELIEADRHLSAKTAAKKPFAALHFGKIIPPGTV